MFNILNNTKTCLITGAFRFPNKDAAAQRVLGIAKAINGENINVIFCGWEQYSRPEDLSLDGIYKYDNFPYYSQAELDIKHKTIFHKAFHSVFKGLKTISWIKNYIKTSSLDVIIVYNANSFFLFYLYKFCKKHKIKLIADCTEWYDGGHLPGGKLGIANIDNNVRIRFIYPKIKNIISISTFLLDFFSKRGCYSIIVPPLVDVNDSKWISSSVNSCSDHENGLLRIMYAGNPGKKDLIIPIIEALSEINRERVSIEFTILGVDEIYIKEEYFKGNKELPLYFNCIGNVDQALVPQFYHQSDFSIIIREPKRYANAGFPTKLVESMCSGVPVIANSTSDISRYVIDGKTGFLIRGNSSSDIVKCFENILKLSIQERKMMKLNAYNCACQNFDYRNYTRIILDFISCK